MQKINFLYMYKFGQKLDWNILFFILIIHFTTDLQVLYKTIK